MDIPTHPSKVPGHNLYIDGYVLLLLTPSPFSPALQSFSVHGRPLTWLNLLCIWMRLSSPKDFHGVLSVSGKERQRSDGLRFALRRSEMLTLGPIADSMPYVVQRSSKRPTSLISSQSSTGNFLVGGLHFRVFDTSISL